MIKARFHLTFPEHLINEPVIHRVGREFDLVTNIRRANIEEHQAWVILEVEGEEGSVARAVGWLTGQGIQVDRIEG
ncbi:MAG: NIL domain-containing protein [Candidatus Velamenicoccus archaeovorus]